jgi:hypothetical protein
VAPWRGWPRASPYLRGRWLYGVDGVLRRSRRLIHAMVIGDLQSWWHHIPMRRWRRLRCLVARATPVRPLAQWRCGPRSGDSGVRRGSTKESTQHKVGRCNPRGEGGSCVHCRHGAPRHLGLGRGWIGRGGSDGVSSSRKMVRCVLVLHWPCVASFHTERKRFAWLRP